MRSIRARRSTFAPAAALCALSCGLAFAGAPAALAGSCPNEQLRSGRSARLPDCRAYELVTPEELGRTADVTFEERNGIDRALAARDGERFAFEASLSYLEPPGPGGEANVSGTRAVFARTPRGWRMKSAVVPALARDSFGLEMLSPDLSMLGFTWLDSLNPTTDTLEVGPVGGPYATVASAPRTIEGQIHEDAVEVVGANEGTASVPAFHDVVFSSVYRAVLPAGPERERAERETEAGYPDLYAWSDGQAHPVNVNDEGKLLSRCGATLGDVGGDSYGEEAHEAVSADGSKIFFGAPYAESPCAREAGETPQLYMRLDGRETLEVSEPEGVNVPPAARAPANYEGASADGSKVFFASATGLTPGAGQELANHLYEYNTEAPEGHRLTLVGSGFSLSGTINPAVVVSADGSSVYYRGFAPGPGGGDISGIFHYETATGKRSFVAVPQETPGEAEPGEEVTPNGRFLLFPSGGDGLPTLIAGPHGLEPELRGEGHNEFYRYDAADGSVMCVSCGEGVAPAEGQEYQGTGGYLQNNRSGPQVPLSISDDGRRVFFQTTAKLVPQDTNKAGSGLAEGYTEVYEWEQQGTEEAPGVFCEVANGCTHLISAGEAVGFERFLGASESGRDVFFASAAQLVPQATPEFTNIYDARMDGGFPAPAPPLECLSCQGVGSPPPAFGAPASLTFVGAGNPHASALPSTPPKGTTHKTRCRKPKTLSHGRCLKRRGHSDRRRRTPRSKSHKGRR